MIVSDNGHEKSGRTVAEPDPCGPVTTTLPEYGGWPLGAVPGVHDFTPLPGPPPPVYEIEKSSSEAWSTVAVDAPVLPLSFVPATHAVAQFVVSPSCVTEAVNGPFAYVVVLP